MWFVLKWYRRDIYVWVHLLLQHVCICFYINIGRGVIWQEVLVVYFKGNTEIVKYVYYVKGNELQTVWYVRLWGVFRCVFRSIWYKSGMPWVTRRALQPAPPHSFHFWVNSRFAPLCVALYFVTCHVVCSFVPWSLEGHTRSTSATSTHLLSICVSPITCLLYTVYVPSWPWSCSQPWGTQKGGPITAYASEAGS